jgi:acyl-coenzyme A synthetase/AMP-(fatty) acid ligase
LGIRDDDRAIMTLPLHYSYGLSVVNSHLHAGGSVVLNPFSVIQPQFWELVARTQARSLPGVPVTYRLLTRLEPSQLSRSTVRTMTQAGGPLTTDLVRHFHDLMDGLGGTFVVMYGQTEATARMAILDHQDTVRKLGSVGRAVPGGQFSVASEPGATSGEIVYSGDNVMLGYAETRHDLACGDQLHGVLRTGDLGALDSDGFLSVTGRLKRIAKVDGKRVSLDDIERMVEFEGGHAVIGGDDTIHVFCAGDAPRNIDELGKELALATGLRRGVFRFQRISELPRTATGKTDYHRLGGLLASVGAAPLP